MNPKLLIFSGSIRPQSYNSTLAKLAASIVSKHQCEATYVDLAEYKLPLFDQDLESKEGMPENAKRLKELMVAHDGFIIASPEYNSAITPLLKNTIDWASRAHTSDESPLKAYKGKFAFIIAASPGALGGLRGLYMLRFILQNIGVTVVPQQLALIKAHEAFDDQGQLKDSKTASQLEGMIKDFILLVRKVKSL